MNQYLNLNVCAPRRLQILRNSASSGKWVNPMTWRQVRFSKFNSQCAGLCAGFNGEHGRSLPVWSTFDFEFSREKFADEVCSRIKHNGWYADAYRSEIIRGIVAFLPHGRTIAGYENSETGERVYYPEIFTDETDAATAADGHAESVAETSREYSERWNEAQSISDDIESKSERRRECLLLARINHARDARRNEARDLKDEIAELRDQLETEFKDIEV